MIGTIHSMMTKVAEFSVSGVVRTRILQTIIAGLLSLNYRNNFKRLAEVIDCNENTVHNWMKRSDLNLVEFNANLIKSEGSGDYAVAFDPSYISKSGKCTPGVGRYWSGPAPVTSFTSHKSQAKSGELVASLRLAMHCRKEFTLVKPNQARFTYGSLC
jgi:hypothetical protein